MNIITNKDCIIVDTTYNAKFVKLAKQIGGKWNGHAWYFPIENKDLVDNLLFDIYGENSIEKPTKVVVRIDLSKINELSSKNAFELYGRVLLKRWRKDSVVRVHKSVAVEKGEFISSSGSTRYPTLGKCDNIILRVTNVPLNLAKKSIEDYGDAIELIEDSLKKENLLSKKQRLLKEIALIDKELEQLNNQK